ncbi:MAG: C39 family peptidase [Oscillospiraceae bacterium]|jgi:hypothetical protein|nr:C39 family peptidase [Oscillospiraceae bacterium]
MKKMVALLLALVLIVALAACEATPPASSVDETVQSVEQTETPDAAETNDENFGDEHKIPYTGLTEIEGAAGVEREADVENSPYFSHPDFANMKSTDTLTLLEGFKTIQQATEWTCGPTSALMVLEWYGKRGDLNEMDLAALRGDPSPGATDLKEMIDIFEGLALLSDFPHGLWDLYSTYDLEDSDYVPEDFIQNTLADGHPILLGWDDWGGHWQVIIGYDTMGTETTADDVLVLADPYDTTDHNQDGYYIISFERLYYNWLNGFDSDFSRNLFLVATPTE